jgi:putative chitinase
MLTAAQLLKLAPNLMLHEASTYAALLSSAMERFGIDTPKRIAFFLAQVVHESGGLTQFRENLNYSAAGLLRAWPNRFKGLIDAQHYERQPAKIANYVYANRMGNGNEQSGDGWKFRGAGWPQITGRTNQKECGIALGVTGDIGDWLATPNGSALASAWFWWSRGLNRYADMDNVDAVADIYNIGHRTEKIGDSIGYDKRLALTNIGLKALA